MAAKKNVLLLIPSFAQPGGTQKLLYDVGKVLAERYNVFECSFNAYQEDHVFQSGNQVLSLEVPEPKNLLQRMVGYLLKAYRLNRIKKRHRIDVTISNLWPADLINALSMGPGLRVSHGVVNVVGNYQNRPMLEQRRLVGWIYRRFHMTVAINDDLMRELAQLFDLPAPEVGRIYPFVDFPPPERVQPVPLPARKRVVCFGRLNHIKNYIPLFTVMEKVKEAVPDVQLLIMGEGPHRGEIVAAARNTSLTVRDDGRAGEEDLVFLGFVDDPYPYLSASDVFALPSQSEGFGLVLVEAMSAGLPILSSDCPTGGPHLIMEGRRPYHIGRGTAEETPYGYLLPVPKLGDDTSGALWEQAMVRLLQNPEGRAAKGANSRLRAREFSRDRIKDQWYLLLDRL